MKSFLNTNVEAVQQCASYSTSTHEEEISLLLRETSEYSKVESGFLICLGRRVLVC